MAPTQYVKSNQLTDDYEPFMVGDKQAGEVHWLTHQNSAGQPTYSGFWRCEPMTFAYQFPGDEIFYVLEGQLLVVLADGQTATLQADDMISFDKGVTSTWTIQSTFKKFFVISNC